jgi:hypothetical protein
MKTNRERPAIPLLGHRPSVVFITDCGACAMAVRQIQGSQNDPRRESCSVAYLFQLSHKVIQLRQCSDVMHVDISDDTTLIDHE